VVLDQLVANWQVVFVLALAVVALVLFVMEAFPLEVTALGILVALGAAGILTPPVLLSGFSSPATITVLMMFILSAAVLQSGIVDWVGDRLGVLMGRSTLRQVLVVGLVVGPVSGFINNTAAVAVMIPLTIRLANDAGQSPSKLLMPLSFAAMLGGTLTLIGTSTNLLGNALREEAGLGSFGMFDFVAVGIIVFGVGMLYLTLVGRFLVPVRVEASRIDERYHLRSFVFEVRVPERSGLVGERVGWSKLAADYDVEALQVRRGDTVFDSTRDYLEYAAGDVLLVSSTRSTLERLADTGIVELVAASEGVENDDGNGGKAALERLHFAEMLVPPTSPAIGRRLEELAVWDEWRVHPVALLTKGRRRVGSPRGHVVRPGDVILVSGAERDVERLTGGYLFHVLGGPPVPVRRPQKAPLVLLVLAGVVVVAALGWAPIVLAATAGVVLVGAMGVLRPVEMYNSVNWGVILLLAGIIPLGIAMETSGAAAMVGSGLASSADYLPPLAVLALVYILTSLLTEILSNNASVVLVVPVVIELASGLGYDPIPFILAAMFAASTSFMTPMGYQTNLMVMGPGGYRYSDFFRVGAPLNLIMAVVAPLTINHFFPIV
jgi:di/tricarboxylate transporter